MQTSNVQSGYAKEVSFHTKIIFIFLALKVKKNITLKMASSVMAEMHCRGYLVVVLLI